MKKLSMADFAAGASKTALATKRLKGQKMLARKVCAAAQGPARIGGLHAMWSALWGS